MTRDAAIRTYCRETERALELPRERRQVLLAVLQRELEDRFPQAEDVTPGVLREEVGAPGEVADHLMEGVPTEERQRYRAVKKRRGRILAAVLVAVTVLALVVAGYLYSNGGIVTIETTHYADGIPEGFPTNGEFRERYFYDEEDIQG